MRIGLVSPLALQDHVLGAEIFARLVGGCDRQRATFTVDFIDGLGSLGICAGGNVSTRTKRGFVGDAFDSSAHKLKSLLHYSATRQKHLILRIDF